MRAHVGVRLHLIAEEFSDNMFAPGYADSWREVCEKFHIYPRNSTREFARKAQERRGRGMRRDHTSAGFLASIASVILEFAAFTFR